MKVNYFAYSLGKLDAPVRAKFDLRPILKAFCKSASAPFKNTFTHSDEHIYLLHQHGDSFLFLITRSNELIHKVNTTNITLGEIQAHLDQGEHLGFASYVLIKEDYFGFGSKSLSPRIGAFIKYINDLLEKLTNNWRFNVEAMLTETTKEEAMRMGFIGKTTITVNSESRWHQDILNTITATASHSTNIGSFEITMKPVRGENIKDDVVKAIEAVGDVGLEKIMLKAKDDLRGKLTDIYLVGKGAVYDMIDTSSEIRISSSMEARIVENTTLHKRLLEFRKNETQSQNNFNDLICYGDDSAWANL